MAVTIQGKTVFKGELDDVLKAIEEGLPKILTDEQTKMELRITQQHRDVNESQFKPYSEQYAKAKGRYKSGKGAQFSVNRSAVDMTLKGAMLRAITRRVTRRAANIVGEVYFSNAKEAAKARGNIERGRNFFGFSEKQWQSIRDKIAALIRK